MKITARLVLLLMSSIGLVYVMLQLYGSHYYTTLMERQIKLESDSLSFNTIGQLSSIQKNTENMVKVASVGIKIFDPSMEAQIYDYLSSIVTGDKESGGHLFGMGLAFNPEYKFLTPYVNYKNGRINRMNLAINDNYTNTAWYQAVQATGKPVWTEPYLSKSNNLFFITYAYPIMQNDKLMAVLKADVSLNHLKSYLQDISRPNQYIVIITKNTGVYVSHPDDSRITVSGLSNRFPENIHKIINEMMTKNAGSGSFFYQGKKYLINYMTMKELNWAVGIVFDENAIRENIDLMEYKNILIIVVGLFFILLVIYVVAKSITKPLCHLTDYVKSISDGDLSRNVPVIKGNDEIAELSRSFSFMQEELKRYIDTERSIAAEKERIDSQIRFAQEVQKSFLPDRKILAADKRFTLSSYLKTAQDVSGDLYDFFFLDEDTLFIVIGDVADKGIPASLYMSVTMAFARVLGKMSSSPEVIATYINNYLILYNKNNMFVTMMILIINIKTGEILLLDAGHGMIKCISKGKVFTPETKTNIALGVKSDVKFEQTSFTLSKGDMIFLYTDGVTDAVNPKKEQFGENRLHDVLTSLNSDFSADTNLSQIIKEVNTFCKGARTADDMAMILFEYKG